MKDAGGAAIAAVLRRSRPGRLDADGVDVHFHPDALTVDGVLTPAVLGGALRRGEVAPAAAKRVRHLIARFAR